MWMKDFLFFAGDKPSTMDDLSWFIVNRSWSNLKGGSHEKDHSHQLYPQGCFACLLERRASSSAPPHLQINIQIIPRR